MLARLEEQALLKGGSSNALAQRLIEEGLKMDQYPQIVFREGAAGRRAALSGTRLDIWQVIDTLRANSNSIEETAAYLGVPENMIRAAVRYYAEHRDEVDEFAARMRALAEREEEAFRREQEVLG